MKKAGLILFVLFVIVALFKFSGGEGDSGERQTQPDEPSPKKGDKRGGDVKVPKKGQTRGGN